MDAPPPLAQDPPGDRSFTAARRRRWVLPLVAVAAALGLVAFLRKDPSELPVYVTGAERMLAGEEIYRPTDAKPFTYPPLFGLPFAPFVVLPEALHRPAWYAVNLLALAAGVLLLRCIARRLGAAGPWMWLAVALLAGRHVLAVLENQSHDLLVAVAVAAAAAAWTLGRPLAAGAAAGLAAALKATPLLLLVPFTLRRSLPALGAMVAVAVGGTLLPDLVTPRADGQAWVAAWFDTMLRGLQPGDAAALEGTWFAGSILNQSLSGTVYRLTTPASPEVVAASAGWVRDVAVADPGPGGRRAATVGAQALVLLLVAWVCRPRRAGAVPASAAPWLRLAQASAVACGMVLLSPMSSKSHFAVLALPALLGVAMAARVRRDPALLSLLAATFALGTLTTKGLVGRELGNLLLGYGAVTWAAVAALLATWRAAAMAERRLAPAVSAALPAEPGAACTPGSPARPRSAG